MVHEWVKAQEPVAATAQENVQEHSSTGTRDSGISWAAYELEMTAAQELENGSTLAKELHCSSMGKSTGDGCNAGTKNCCSFAGVGTTSCRAALKQGIAAVKTGSLGIIGSLVF